MQTNNVTCLAIHHHTKHGLRSQSKAIGIYGCSVSQAQGENASKWRRKEAPTNIAFCKCQRGKWKGVCNFADVRCLIPPKMGKLIDPLQTFPVLLYLLHQDNLTIFTAPRHTSLLRTSHPSETCRKSRPPSRTAAIASSLMR